MPKHNANEMVMAWLDAKIHENPDSFDAINAENCKALILKQRKQMIRLGAHFCNLKKQRNKLRKELDDEKIAKALANPGGEHPLTCPCEPVPWWEAVTYSMLRPTCSGMEMNKE